MLNILFIKLFIGTPQINGFRQLRIIEQDFLHFALVEMEHQNSPKGKKKRFLNQVESSGSIRQGSISSSLFNPNCRENGDKICKQVDIDIICISDMELKTPSCLEDVQGKLGLVAIRSHCFKFLPDIGYNYTQEFLKHFYVKKFMLELMSILEAKELNNLNQLFQAYLRHRKRQFNKITIYPKSIISKATSQRYFSVYIDNKIFLTVNMDFAFVIKTKFTPNILKEFSERTSYNLSRSVLDHLFIVAKSSHEEKSNKNTTEWSYSFCHIENHIFTDVFTDTHNLIFLVTKSIFKKHIQPLNNNLLTSYLMKTISFWRFENEKCSQDDWFDDAMILSQTHNLFKDLKRFLEKGFLPMYFIPKLNLIERMDTKLRKNVIGVIDHKILKSSFQELFDVEELKDAHELLQELKSAIIYGKRMYTFLRTYFPRTLNKD